MRGTSGTVRGTEGPVTVIGPLVIARNPFTIAPFPLRFHVSWSTQISKEGQDIGLCRA